MSMTNNDYKLDLVIPIVKVDIPTFRNNLPHLLKFLPVKRIVLIGAKEIEPLVCDLNIVEFQDEDLVVPGLSLSKIKQIKKSISGTDRRSGWYYQQFIKMAYALVCTDEYYLIWDADTIPIKPLSFFDANGIPYMDYRNYEPKDECYTETQLNLLPNQLLYKKEHKSFIAEHMLINVKIMRELIDKLTSENSNGKSTFFENIMYTIPRSKINLSGFSEFECYAAYVLNTHNDSYKLRFWRNLRNAKTYIGRDITKEKAKWIAECFDVISMEDFDRQWILCKILCRYHKSIKFSTLYKIINPIYNIYFDVRFAIRTLVKG